MPWSEAELAEMKAAWERSLRTRTQAELDEMLLTRCEDVNEYGDEDDDLMKVIEAGGDIELAAMYGLERVWEALDRLEKHKSLQSEKYQRLFAKFRRLQRAWQDDAEDPELARMRDGMRDAYLSRDVARSECAKAQNEVAALKGIVSSLMVARGGAMVPHPPIPPAPLRDSVGPSQGPAKRPAEGPPDRAPLSPLTRAPINKRKKPPSPGKAAFLAAWEAEIHSKLGT